MDRRASIVATGCVLPDDDSGAYLAVREHVADLKALLQRREPDRLRPVRQIVVSAIQGLHRVSRCALDCKINLFRLIALSRATGSGDRVQYYGKS
jgi:hypothetical protein